MADINAPIDDNVVIAWFSSMSMTNQFAAGVNPEDWARVQARMNPDLDVNELERRAKVWRDYMLKLAEEG